VIYIACVLIGYVFGNTTNTYLAVFLVAVITGAVNPSKDFEQFKNNMDMKQFKPAPDGTLQQKADFYAEKYGIEKKLFRALIKQESRWNPRATSHVGASGLTQLMPATAKESCRLSKSKIYEVDLNLNCGAKYFSQQLKRFGRVDLALAAYNSGPERVARLGRIPRISETQHYVKTIMKDAGVSS